MGLWFGKLTVRGFQFSSYLIALEVNGTAVAPF